MKDISNLAYSTPVVYLFADDCTLYVDIQLKLKDIVHYLSKECDNFKTVSKLHQIPVNPSVKSCVTHSAIEIFILAVPIFIHDPSVLLKMCQINHFYFRY